MLAGEFWELDSTQGEAAEVEKLCCLCPCRLTLFFLFEELIKLLLETKPPWLSQGYPKERFSNLVGLEFQAYYSWRTPVAGRWLRAKPALLPTPRLQADEGQEIARGLWPWTCWASRPQWERGGRGILRKIMNLGLGDPEASRKAQ